MAFSNNHLKEYRALAGRIQLWELGKYAAVMATLFWLLMSGARHVGYNWQWYRVPAYFGSLEGGRLTAGPLIEGLAITLKITVISLGLASLIGLVTALFRLSGSPVARAVARCYLEMIRNTPLLVQLFFIYFVLSPILDMGRFSSAVLALSLFEGAYASEIFRAGIVSIDPGQWEAALSSGLSRFQAYRYVILPQAVRRMLPPLTSQAISLIKDSALVSTIAIYDLTMQGQSIIADTYLTFEVWFAVAAVYLVLALLLSSAVHAMEKRMRAKTA